MFARSYSFCAFAADIGVTYADICAKINGNFNLELLSDDESANFVYFTAATVGVIVDNRSAAAGNLYRTFISEGHYSNWYTD